MTKPIRSFVLSNNLYKDVTLEASPGSFGQSMFNLSMLIICSDRMLDNTVVFKPTLAGETLRI